MTKVRLWEKVKQMVKESERQVESRSGKYWHGQRISPQCIRFRFQDQPVKVHSVDFKFK